MQPIQKILLLTISLFFLTFSVYGQTPRNNYGGLLELDDVVLHGAGQSPDAFESYFELMPEDDKPIIYMYYVRLSELDNTTWVDRLKRELEKYHSQFLIPQIGVSMSPGDDPDANYEQDVADGLYDAQIANLVQGLNDLGRPAYLRIGYEFNGIAWNGYEPGPYKEAFKRITDAIRAEDLEVATVWCAAVGGGTDVNYLNYYPGDEYVDWWGIDLFSASHFSEPMTAEFMVDADEYNKPVMIGETTPRYIGADDDEDWEDWFKLYFDFIEDNPGIKAVCYINWNWAEYEQWEDWGNAQLSQNDFVRVNYVHKLRKSFYYSTTTQQEFRNSLNFNDNTTPDAVVISESSPGQLPIRIQWDGVTDDNGVVYSVYKDSVLHATLYGTEFVDDSYAAGDSSIFHVSSMDRAGNESELSNALTFSLSDTIIKTINTDFRNDISPWTLTGYNGGQASYNIQTSGIAISIDNSTTTNWHVQLVQNIDILKGYKYYIESTARAVSPGIAALILQQSHDPFGIPIYHGVNLGTTNSHFQSATYEATDSDNMNVGFFLGELTTGNTALIDSIKLLEINGLAGIPKNEVPVSVAGDDFTYQDPYTNLELNGSGSYDPDGSISSFQWEQLSGLEVMTIDNPGSTVTSLSDVKKGEYLFRLEVTDNNGDISVDEIEVVIDTIPIVSSLNEVIDISDITLSPNPTNGSISFRASDINHQNEVDVRIFDMRGKVILPSRQVNINGSDESITIDVSSLVSGIYIMQVSAGDKSYIGRFMKLN